MDIKEFEACDYDTGENLKINRKGHFHCCGLNPCECGNAMDTVFEDMDGGLWIWNGEYGSQVNYCPICGYKAKQQIEV